MQSPQVVSSVLDEYDEVEEDDRDRFKDQLCSMGLFARQVSIYYILITCM